VNFVFLKPTFSAYSRIALNSKVFKPK